MRVLSILSTKGDNVVTIEGDATVIDAAKTLKTNKIGAVVVRDHDNGVAGILSERDIILAMAEKGAEALNEPVRAIMTDRVVTCRTTDSVDTVMERMTTGRFRHMPVIDGESLLGIISIGDVVKHHIAEVEMEATALKTYLVAG